MREKEDVVVPSISRGASPKRWMKYLRRTEIAPVKVKNPERYLHASRRR